MTDVKNRTDKIQGKIVHVYDDIEEADNNLPIWWLVTFYVTCAFGLAYWFYFHEFGMGELARAKYDRETALAKAEQERVTDESLEVLAQNDEAVAAGSAIFGAQCVACHDTKGQGREGLGPNLTDGYWVHGGAPTNIHSTVVNGVAAKGMPAWEPILGPEGVKQVVAYVLTMRNTNVPGRAPEGDLWDPGAAQAQAETTEPSEEAVTQ